MLLIDESVLQAELAERGIVSVGDVNGDGTKLQISGNVVKVTHPPVTLPSEASRITLPVAQNAVESRTKTV